MSDKKNWNACAMGQKQERCFIDMQGKLEKPCLKRKKSNEAEHSLRSHLWFEEVGRSINTDLSDINIRQRC